MMRFLRRFSEKCYRQHGGCMKSTLISLSDLTEIKYKQLQLDMDKFV